MAGEKTKKTQDELELPAKVYQLVGIEDRLEGLTAEVKSLRETIVNNSNNQVTSKQFEDSLLAIRSAFEEKLKDEIGKVHLKYGPIERNNRWFLRAIGLEAIIVFAQVVFITYLLNRGG